MQPKRAVGALLLAFVAVSVGFVVWQGTTAPATAPGASAVAGTDQVVVYYFHGRVRCLTCEQLETYAREAVEAGFAPELAAGRLAWRSIDVSAPPHRHFAADYQVQYQSVVLVEMKGGRQQRWRNLDRIWDLVGDKRAYIAYVQRELRAFLEG